ncbi:hypothetical protein CSUI_007571 [Cystoisospora suis]|uniref:Uncharacterized protein n=1 Tax=Cystoisospora suis TaxID=483139 RepID=A0A2C6KQ54_9APIC|nr:hypothetical protein CSUI_007571 [Cystoisospora suis]
MQRQRLSDSNGEENRSWTESGRLRIIRGTSVLSPRQFRCSDMWQCFETMLSFLRVTCAGHVRDANHIRWW